VSQLRVFCDFWTCHDLNVSGILYNDDSPMSVNPLILWISHNDLINVYAMNNLTIRMVLQYIFNLTEFMYGVCFV
jgi:hypothetical protein